MKIAFVYDVVYPYVKGGGEKRICELSLKLAERGHEVHIFGMKYWPGPDVFEKDGITYHGVCRPKRLYVKGRRSIFQAVYFPIFLFFPLLREKFDVIDCQAFPYFPVFPAWLASKITRSHLVVTWLEVWGDYWYRYLGRKGIFGIFIERLVARINSHHITISHSTAKAMEEIGVQGPIPIIPYGIDPLQIQNVSPAGDKSDILFAGRLIRDKNVDLLLRALAQVRKEIPSISAVIIGDGPERRSLETLSHELGLDDIVTFKGFLPGDDSVIAAMKSSEVFVLPSSREGFGIVAIEAMACGLPVVTVNHPQNAAQDLVLDGKTGYVTGLSPEQLAIGIISAFSGRVNMQDDIARNVKEFGWDSVVDKLVQAYDRK